MLEVDVICCSMCIHLCICKGGEMSHFNITPDISTSPHHFGVLSSTSLRKKIV